MARSDKGSPIIICKAFSTAERDTEANRKRSKEYLATIAAISPNKMIFLNESGVTTSMTRLWGRAPKSRHWATGKC
jgi:hypothetical protein